MGAGVRGSGDGGSGSSGAGGTGTGGSSPSGAAGVGASTSGAEGEGARIGRCGVGGRGRLDARRGGGRRARPLRRRTGRCRPLGRRVLVGLGAAVVGARAGVVAVGPLAMASSLAPPAPIAQSVARATTTTTAAAMPVRLRRRPAARSGRARGGKPPGHGSWAASGPGRAASEPPLPSGPTAAICSSTRRRRSAGAAMTRSGAARALRAGSTRAARRAWQVSQASMWRDTRLRSRTVSRPSQEARIWPRSAQSRRPWRDTSRETIERSRRSRMRAVAWPSWRAGMPAASARSRPSSPRSACRANRARSRSSRPPRASCRTATSAARSAAVPTGSSSSRRRRGAGAEGPGPGGPGLHGRGGPRRRPGGVGVVALARAHRDHPGPGPADPRALVADDGVEPGPQAVGVAELVHPLDRRGRRCPGPHRRHRGTTPGSAPRRSGGHRRGGRRSRPGRPVTGAVAQRPDRRRWTRGAVRASRPAGRDPSGPPRTEEEAGADRPRLVALRGAGRGEPRRGDAGASVDAPWSTSVPPR